METSSSHKNGSKEFCFILILFLLLCTFINCSELDDILDENGGGEAAVEKVIDTNSNTEPEENTTSDAAQPDQSNTESTNDGTPSTSSIGKACKGPADCPGAICHTEANGAPGGYCYKGCDLTYNNKAQCPSGSACLPSDDGNAKCLKLCDADADCRTGYLCYDVTEAHATCLPKCQKDTDCYDGEVCDSDGACVESSTNDKVLGRIGSKCKDNKGCKSGYCATNLPGGYCSTQCSQGKPCGSGAVCVDAGTNNVCLGSCKSNADCRSAYFCASLSGGDGACVPRCTQNDDCEQGQYCDSSSGQCIQGSAPTTPPSMSVSVQNFGSKTVNFQGVTLDVKVPKDGISFTVIGKGNPGEDYYIDSVVSPTGNTVRVRGTQSSKGVLSVQFPNTPKRSIQPGTYKVTLYMFSGQRSNSTDVQFQVLHKQSPQPPTKGTLDLNLYFVGVPGLTASSAPNHQKFKSLMAKVEGIYKNAGVSFGKITYHDVSKDDADELSVCDLDKGEMERLFKMSKSQSNKALNFFFIREIREKGQNTGTVGIAGGIPGPAYIHGTAGSGVLVTAEAFEQQVQFVAETMAHEGGHYLGLYHLTESTGQMHDPLPDTPECPREVGNRDGKKYLIKRSLSKCKGYGIDNNMFWTGDGKQAQEKLSPHQKFVLMRNPLIK